MSVALYFLSLSQGVIADMHLQVAQVRHAYSHTAQMGARLLLLTQHQITPQIRKHSIPQLSFTPSALQY
jgi:ABC-type uncharacterized transport system ATPase component